MIKKSLFFVVFILVSISASQAGTVKIYAAASLSNAVTEIAKIYQMQHPSTKVVTVFGASSALARQLQAGAYSDLFFSADQDWMKALVHKKMVEAKYVQPLLYNQLVAISAQHLKITFRADPNFKFAQAFQGYVCTGQMESVPAGKYAKQSLLKLNWLQALKGRIVGTDDVRAALAFVERGECQVGIVYKTDAMISQKVKIIGTFPSNLHTPIMYPLALTKQGQQNKEAVQFEKFIRHHSSAKKVFHQYGFRLSSLRP